MQHIDLSLVPSDDNNPNDPRLVALHNFLAQLLPPSAEGAPPANAPTPDELLQKIFEIEEGNPERRAGNDELMRTLAGCREVSEQMSAAERRLRELVARVLGTGVVLRVGLGNTGTPTDT
jgi:hypothetical protein